jgi:hypothetical protein
MTMIQVSARRRAPRIALAIAGALLLSSLVGLVFVAGGLVPATLVLLVLFALPVGLLLGRTRRPRQGRVLAETYTPRRQLQFQRADGSLQQALTTPVQQHGSRLVLTADGYIVLGDDGRPLHCL